MKHTGQESGGELCEVFKLWSFLQSQSVDNVCKLLQLLWDFVLQTAYRGFALDPIVGLCLPDEVPHSQMKILGAASVNKCNDCRCSLLHLSSFLCVLLVLHLFHCASLRAWSICRNLNQFQIRFSESAQSIYETETSFAKLVKPNCITCEYSSRPRSHTGQSTVNATTCE